MSTPPVNRTQIIVLLVMAGVAIGIIYFGYSLVIRTLPSMQPTAVPTLPSTQDIPDTATIQSSTNTLQPVQRPPAIYDFIVNPPEIPFGSCLTIYWDVSMPETSIRLERENEIIYDGEATQNEINDCPLTFGELTYHLEASNVGGTTNDRVSVKIIEPTPTPSSPLINNWTLLFYLNADGKYVSPKAGTIINARFNSDRSLSGFSSCNTYTGSFTLIDPDLSINNLEKSGKNCFDFEGVIEQEEDFLLLLSLTSSYVAKIDELELYNAIGEKVLVFAACKDTTCQSD